MSLPSLPCSRLKPVGAPVIRTLVRVRCNASTNIPNPDENQGSNPQQENQAQQGAVDDSTAIITSLSSLSKGLGRLGKGSNLVLASDSSNETWRKLDKKVNKYPGQRSFTAIGESRAVGGSNFRSSMISAVERVVGPGTVHPECVSQRASGSGTYISVTVGPVWIQDSEQVLSIYNEMRSDERLRWFI